MRFYSNVKAFWGLSYTCFRIFGAFFQLGKLGPSALVFAKLSNVIILTYGPLNVLSRIGSNNSFGKAFQEILLNNYSKSNFKNPGIWDFVRTFWNSSLKKSPLFRTLNANISKKASYRKINEPILKSSHQELSYERESLQSF